MAQIHAAACPPHESYGYGYGPDYGQAYAYDAGYETYSSPRQKQPPAQATHPTKGCDSGDARGGSSCTPAGHSGRDYIRAATPDRPSSSQVQPAYAHTIPPDHAPEYAPDAFDYSALADLSSPLPESYESYDSSPAPELAFPLPLHFFSDLPPDVQAAAEAREEPPGVTHPLLSYYIGFTQLALRPDTLPDFTPEGRLLKVHLFHLETVGMLTRLLRQGRPAEGEVEKRRRLERLGWALEEIVRDAVSRHGASC